MVEVYLSTVKGVCWMLVTLGLESEALYGPHKEENVLVPPNTLVVFVSL